MSMKQETITPDRARKLLEGNTNNRHVSKPYVVKLARDMKAGKWRITGDPIKIAGDGTVLDGQHRLLACISADVEIETFVFYGAEKNIVPVLDSGRGRTLADEMLIANEKNTHVLAAIVSVAWKYLNGKMLRPETGTRVECLSLLRKYPDMREAAAFAMGNKVTHAPVLPPSTLAFCAWAYGHSPHAEEAHIGLKNVQYKMNLTASDPLRLLVQACDKQRNSAQKFTTMHILALTIKAMNAHLSDEKLSFLRWRRFGTTVESFPPVLDFDLPVIEHEIATEISEAS